MPPVFSGAAVTQEQSNREQLHAPACHVHLLMHALVSFMFSGAAVTQEHQDQHHMSTCLLHALDNTQRQQQQEECAEGGVGPQVRWLEV